MWHLSICQIRRSYQYKYLSAKFNPFNPIRMIYFSSSSIDSGSYFSLDVSLTRSKMSSCFFMPSPGIFFMYYWFLWWLNYTSHLRTSGALFIKLLMNLSRKDDSVISGFVFRIWARDSSKTVKNYVRLTPAAFWFLYISKIVYLFIKSWPKPKLLFLFFSLYQPQISIHTEQQSSPYPIIILSISLIV